MTSLSREDLASFSSIAIKLADAAAEVTVRHFRAETIALQNKKAGAGFDPVTLADRGAEEAMRKILAVERPDDGVYGEEVARTVGTSGLTWVLDPIDGTRAYIAGLPVWGTLIGLDDGERGRIGIIDQPFIGERYIGVVDGAASRAELRGRCGVRPLRTRSTAEIGTAILFSTDPTLFEGEEAAAFDALRDEVRLTRYGTDCYAYALLAMGLVDLVVESGLHAYDVAGLIPVIAAAGGIVTDWRGGDCRWGGRVLAAGNRQLHESALRILSKAA